MRKQALQILISKLYFCTYKMEFCPSKVTCQLRQSWGISSQLGH